MSKSITQAQVDELLRLAALVEAAPFNEHIDAFDDMHDQLTPEVVRQLCNGWTAWVNYQ